MSAKQKQVEKKKEDEAPPAAPRSWTFYLFVILSFFVPVVLPTIAMLFEIHHPEFHSPIRRSGRTAKSDGTRTLSDFCNFDRLHCCNGSVAIRMPRTVEQVQSVVKESYLAMKKISSEYSGVGEKMPTPLIRMIGAGHSMSPIVCTSPDTEYPLRHKILMSLDHLNIPEDAPEGTMASSLSSSTNKNDNLLVKVLKTFPADHEGTRPSKKARAHVWASGGIRLKHLNDKLWDLGYSLFNTGMIQEQSVAGVIATAVHGTGIMNTPINQHVVRVDVVLANGTLAVFSRESHPEIFKHARMHLGLFGVVVGVAFEVRERYYVRRTEEILSEAALIDSIMLNEDSIKERIGQNQNQYLEGSYTRTQAWWLDEDRVLIQDMSQELSVEQVASSETFQALMRSSFLFAAEKLVTDFLYLAMTTISVYIPVITPIIHKLIPLNHLAKRDFVQRSYEAFTHPGVNYHSVRYSETELFVPAENAGKAWDLYKNFLKEHHSVSSVCNINTINPLRTVAPDDIPLSPSNGKNSVAFSFTLVYRDSFKQCSSMLQNVLGPLGGRPHWGKWFSPMLKNRVDVEELYGKEAVEEFAQAVKSVDSYGLFRPMIFEDLFF